MMEEDIGYGLSIILLRSQKLCKQLNSHQDQVRNHNLYQQEQQKGWHFLFTYLSNINYKERIWVNFIH
jgi:hypothetical protein